MWDTMSSCCLTFPTCPVSCCLLTHNSPVGSSSCTAEQFICTSSPRGTIAERRKAELCHTLAVIHSPWAQACLRSQLLTSGIADVTGQGPHSVLMGSTASSSRSQRHTVSLQSARSLLGSKRALSCVVTKPDSFLLHTGG